MGKRSAVREQLELYERSLGPRSGRLAATMQVTRTKLGCSARLFKFVNMGLAIFLALSGVAILAAGAYMGKNAEIFEVVGSGFTNAVIACGVFLLVTGALGMAGSMNESKMILLIYSGVLSCLILALIIMGSFAVSKNDRDVVGRAWQYLSNDERVHVQYYYACCGFNFCNADRSRCQLPGNPCPANFAGPCGPLLETDYKKMATGFGATAIVLGIVSILGVVAACCINSGIDAASEAETAERRNATSSGGGKKSRR